MASVTIDRIDGVRRDIADAVNRTAEGSLLPEPEQQRLLAQACAETCALLTDWVSSPQWEELRPAHEVLLSETLADQERFRQLLGPLFADAMERTLKGSDGAGERARRIDEARAEADKTVRDALATSRRYRRLSTEQVFAAAVVRVGKLRDEVCQLARELSGPQRDPARLNRWLRQARTQLRKAGKFLLTLTVTLMVTVPGPGPVVHDLDTWAHDAKAVMVHELAAQAQPGVRVAPPSPGPRLR
jgi:hypothetical protein